MVVFCEYFLLLLLTNAFLYADAQIICRIDIDSTSRLWIDSTPTLVPTNNTPFCVGYLFRQTSLNCATKYCPSVETSNDKCIQYYNAGKGFSFVKTCTAYCSYRIYAIHLAQTETRYKNTELCVPSTINNNLKKCDDKQFNEKGECISKICTDDCVNGRCDQDELCTCLDGYRKDTTTNKCVLKECFDACDNGHCTEYDQCICKTGFKKDPRNKYKCVKINCPDNEYTAYCQRECTHGRCRENNGFCDKGECKCREGFKKNSYEFCDEIKCPDQDHTNFCQSECQNSACTQDNGRCEEGECRCNNGYKKNFNKLYSCEKIKCPDWDPTNFCHRECQSSNCTQNNGFCLVRGDCKCKDGFKKDENNNKMCIKIICPSTGQDNERYCRLQCVRSCENGACGKGGTCQCNIGFKKDRYNNNKCNKIDCPSSKDEDNAYCKSICENFCENGTCDNKGLCKCKNGFANKTSNIFKCSHIVCPTSTTSSVEDKSYCVSKCNTSCTNGKCNGSGICECAEGFVETSNASVDCYHTCNLDGSCHWTILVGILGGGATVIVVVLVCAVAAVMIRKKKRKKQNVKDNGRFNLGVSESTEQRPSEDTERHPIQNSRELDTYLEPRPVMQEHSRNVPQQHASNERGIVGLMPPSGNGANRSYLELLSGENDTETPISSIISSPIYDTPYDHCLPARVTSPIYDTPYDHVNPNRRMEGPMTQKARVATYYYLPPTYQGAVTANMPKPPNICQIQKQRQRLRAATSPWALYP